MAAKRFAVAFLACGLTGTVCWAARPQGSTTTPSLADLARQQREQKKAQTKETRVWTNDNIPTTPGTISVVGNAAPFAAPEATPPGGMGRPSPNDIASAQHDVDNARQDLSNKKADLDLLQRDYELKNAMISGSPSYPSDRDGQALLKRMQQQIADKKQEVQQAEQKVKDLEAKLAALRSAGPAAPTTP